MTEKAAVSAKEKKPFSTTTQTMMYTSVVAVLGLVIILAALFDLPQNLSGVLLFAALAAAAELSSVELFVSSRNSNVSVSSIIAIASILLFGPLAGALTHCASGLMTAITITYLREKPENPVSWIRRSAFNAGMLVIAAFLAGQAYVIAGGVPGAVARPGNLLPLALASTVDAVVNIVLLIGVITLQTSRPPLMIWKQDFQWAVPISIVGGVLGGGAMAIAYQMFGLPGLLVFSLPVWLTSYSFRLYVRNTRGYVNRLEQLNKDLDLANRSLNRANQELETANLELLETLGAVVDAYDVYTGGHSTQVAVYAVALAQKLGLPEEDQVRAAKAALVHDIGKVGVTDAIIGKQGPLSPEEYNLVKRHTTIGAEIVGRMTGLQELVPLVKHHHERWDGKGYPSGLTGEEIPLLARVLALADSIDVACSDRPYRHTFSFRQVREEIARCSGTQFDPQVVGAFFALLEEKGPEVLKNSAASVDKTIHLKAIGQISQTTRYLKKSQVAEHEELGVRN
jgi:putative nucleotidyltransferase with HDIG domain